MASSLKATDSDATRRDQACDKSASVVPIERVGVCSWSYRLPLDHVAREMKHSGVTGIHLALLPFIALDGLHGATEGADALQAVKARVASGEWRLFATMISFPKADASASGKTPDASWERNKAIFAKAVALTRELRAPYLTVFTPRVGSLDAHNPQASDAFCARVVWMRDLCKQSGIALLLEPGHEKAETLVRFLRKVPDVGINYDPANSILFADERPRLAVKTLMPWIRQVHMKDAKPASTPSTSCEETPWGEGAVGGNAFVAELDRLGYTGNYIVERESGNQRATDIARAIAKLTGRTSSLIK